MQQVGYTYQWTTEPEAHVLVIKEFRPSSVPYLHRVPTGWRWSSSETDSEGYYGTTWRGSASVGNSGGYKVVAVSEPKPGDKVRGIGVSSGLARVGTLTDGPFWHAGESSRKLIGSVGQHWHVRPDSLELVVDEVSEETEAPAPPEDLINTPSHYTSRVPGIECKDVAGYFEFNRGAALKYIWRAGLKGDAAQEIEDLNKARKFLEFEILRLGGEVK
jgi:hypothetical protein